MTDFALRPWEEADAASLVRCADDPGIAANLRDVFPSPYGLPDAEWFIRDCMAREGTGQLCRAIVVGGEAVGSISVLRGADVYRKSAEIGYWLGRDFWGQGLTTEAVKRMCREAFDAWDIVRIHAEVFAPNAASRRVLEKAGFSLEGTRRAAVYKNGQVLDACVYALLREEIEP